MPYIKLYAFQALQHNSKHLAFVQKQIDKIEQGLADQKPIELPPSTGKTTPVIYPASPLAR